LLDALLDRNNCLLILAERKACIGKKLEKNFRMMPVEG